MSDSSDRKFRQRIEYPERSPSRWMSSEQPEGILTHANERVVLDSYCPKLDGAARGLGLANA